MGIKNTAAFLTGMMLFFALPSAKAQTTLDENCVVSVLNRTAQVKPDGTYSIPNTPANFGQVRARATCVKNGQTISGQSAFFNVPANGVIVVGDIPLGVVDPIPQSLTVISPLPSLTSVGVTVTLTVAGQYADGSSKDLRLGNSGTSYNSSNPLIATVSADGLVTAASSGTVMISATNDGTLGMTRLQVILSVDTDGDGIPDDIELFNGLDPNNAIDALEDPDQDGLTNKEELIDFGTDPQNPDTDGDGIKDGEEVNLGANGFVTNPLLVDTDGDGIQDGLEVQTGSDPTDNTSFNLAQALSTIEVNPTSFTLTFNTLVGEASEQLTVTGNLIDGTTIDLTSTQRGTNYTSSDLTICSFGANSGEIFSGAEGSCTVTVNNNGFSASAMGAIASFAPTALSTINLPGYANNVDVDQDYAYVAAGSAGLQIVDIRDKINPLIVGALDTPGIAIDVKISGNFAYIADGTAGLQIIEISDPTLPVLAGVVDTPGVARALVLSSTRAYLADGASGLIIIDISNPLTANILSITDTGGTAKGLAMTESLDYAVVAVGEPEASAVKIVDINDEINPLPVGSVLMPPDAKTLVVKGTVAYVALHQGGFQIVDFSVPTNPVITGPGIPSIPGVSGVGPRDIGVFGPFALFADNLFIASTPIVNINDPSNLLIVDTLLSTPTGNYGGTGIAVTREFVYVTEVKPFVADDFRSDGDTRLFIAQYLSIEDKAGIPPIANIISPAPGEVLMEGAAQLIKVDVTDDVGIAAVNFMIDGVVVFTDVIAPYEFVVTIPVGTTNLTLGASAFDFGGNLGFATDVQLSVIPDPGTTVTGSVVDENQNPLSGIPVTTAGNRSSVSGTDGSFSIFNVPTIDGDILVTGTFNAPDGRSIQGMSTRVSPVRDGITIVGNIVIPSCRQQPLGAVSWWPLDEISGTTTIDVINGKDGVFSGTTRVEGQIFNARRFVLNDAMLAPGDGPLDIVGNQVTIEAWVKLENNKTTAQIFTGVIGKKTFPDRQSYLMLFESGPLASDPSRILPPNQWQLEYILTNASGFRVHNQVTNIIIDVDGNFHHFAMTYDGTSVRLYVDGILKGTFPYSGNLKSLPSEPIEVFGGSPFSADEISIYARALTTLEINDLYLAGKSGGGMCLP